MIILALILLGILSYGYWNTFRPILREVDVNFADSNQLINGMRILHLSDMHMERISVSPTKLYDQLKNTNPDMIVLTGDYLDQPENLPKWESYFQQIARLSPKYGMYAVLGNHDYRLRGKVQDLIDIMESYGCEVLRNESRQVEFNGQRINIIGIDDHHSGRSRIGCSFNGIDEDAISLVITHDPDVIIDLDNYKVDYLMAGHFHGGQCNIPFAFRLVPMGKLPKDNMYKGLLVYKGTYMYISEGLGQSALNIRVNSRPEITLHKI